MKPELWIKSDDRHAFRSGKWAQVVGITSVTNEGEVSLSGTPVEVVVTPVYVVKFSDGTVDEWVVYDPDGQYSFSRERGVDQ